MTFKSTPHDQDHLDLVYLYALQALPPGALRDAEAQISECTLCRKEIDTLRPVVDSFVAWPTAVLQPSTSMWDRLSQRIADESGTKPIPAPVTTLPKPEWEEAAPGIYVQLLATNSEKNEVSMLVRLDPGTDYPPHRHAGVEELHLLQGELWIDEKKLFPGDYIRAAADSVDHRVWSETGCTCVLITSTKDEIL